MNLHTSPNGRMHFASPRRSWRRSPPKAAPQSRVEVARPEPPSAPPPEVVPTAEAPAVEAAVEALAVATPPPELHLEATEEGWAVVDPRQEEEPVFVAPTKAQATRRGKALARQHQAVLHVHTRTGKRQRSFDFRGDEVEVQP